MPRTLLLLKSKTRGTSIFEFANGLLVTLTTLFAKTSKDLVLKKYLKQLSSSVLAYGLPFDQTSKSLPKLV